MLPQSYPNYKTVHRRFQAWCRDEILRRLLTDVANELPQPTERLIGMTLSGDTNLLPICSLQ